MSTKQASFSRQARKRLYVGRHLLLHQDNFLINFVVLLNTSLQICTLLSRHCLQPNCAPKGGQVNNYNYLSFTRPSTVIEFVIDQTFLLSLHGKIYGWTLIRHFVTSLTLFHHTFHSVWPWIGTALETWAVSPREQTLPVYYLALFRCTAKCWSCRSKLLPVAIK